MSKFSRHLTTAVICGLLLAVCAPHDRAHAQSIFGDLGTPAWSRMYKYFESRFGATAKDDIVLILPTATNAAWDDPIKTLRFVEMYKWGDWVPAKAWQYAPNASKRISDGYRYFLKAALLNSIDANGTASQTLKNAAKRTTEDVDFERNEYNQVQANADNAYSAYVAAHAPPRLTKSQFLRDQGWDVEIATKKKRLDTALQTLVVLSGNLADPDVDLLQQGLIRFNNPKQQISLPPTRAVLNNPDLWQNYYVSLIDKDIFAFLDEGNPQSQMINEQQQTSQTFEQQWHASASVSFLGLFRAGGASAEQTRREQHIKQNATAIAISFENIDTFNVVRGEWFSDNLISRFAPKLPADAFNAVFGANGQLEIIPKTLLVGRGMSFTIYADSQSLDYLYEHFEAGADAGIFIGYWRIGGEGGYSSTRTETKVYKYNDRIVFTDLSGRAKILGMLAKNYSAGVSRQALLSAESIKSLVPDNARATAQKKIESEWAPSTVFTAATRGLNQEILKDLTPQ